MGLYALFLLSGCASIPKSYCLAARSAQVRWKPISSFAAPQRMPTLHSSSHSERSPASFNPEPEGQGGPPIRPPSLKEWAENEMDRMEDEIEWIRSGYLDPPMRRQLITRVRDAQKALIDLLGYSEGDKEEKYRVTLKKALMARQDAWSLGCQE
jgi:hypothetical protein